MSDTLVEFADEFGVDPLSHGDGWRQCFRSASGVDYPRDKIWEAILEGLIDLSIRVEYLEIEDEIRIEKEDEGDK